MDIIDFRVERAENYHRVVAIFINGRPLSELAEEFEMPRYKLRSDYVGVPIEEMPNPLQHFSVAPEAYEPDEDRVQVLGCNCGTTSCWPLLCHIIIGENEVVWSDFFQPFRGPESAGGYWRYDGFGPFTFERRQYEQALAVLGNAGGA